MREPEIFERGTVLGAIGGNATKHLMILCNNPVEYTRFENSEKAVLTVNVTSWRDERPGWNDPACVLQEGDHPFIRHKSFVLYSFACISRASIIQKKIQEREFQVREKLSSDVFFRVMDGFERSDRTKMDILRFIKMLKTADQFEYLHLQTDR